MANPDDKHWSSNRDCEVNGGRFCTSTSHEYIRSCAASRGRAPWDWAKRDALKRRWENSQAGWDFRYWGYLRGPVPSRRDEPVLVAELRTSMIFPPLAIP